MAPIDQPASLIALTVMLLQVTAVVADSAPDRRRQQELRHLVQQDCGSCHGMTLKGGLGPALTPRALSGKPSELLLTTVLDGRPGTAMPPWRPFLTEAEGRWVVDSLIRGDLVPTSTEISQ